MSQTCLTVSWKVGSVNDNLYKYLLNNYEKRKKFQRLKPTSKNKILRILAYTASEQFIQGPKEWCLENIQSSR